MDIITSYYLREKKKRLLLQVINQQEKYDCKVISYFKSCENVVKIIILVNVYTIGKRPSIQNYHNLVSFLNYKVIVK